MMPFFLGTPFSVKTRGFQNSSILGSVFDHPTMAANHILMPRDWRRPRSQNSWGLNTHLGLYFKILVLVVENLLFGGDHGGEFM